MFKFKFLLWAFAQLLQRKINSNPNCARYVQGKRLSFQIRTASGIGRHYVIENGVVRSFAGLTNNAQFTLSFVNATKGFEILSARDAQPAFLRGVGSKDLIIGGDFLEVLWFQGLTAFLQPQKVISAYDLTAY
ncbi:helicase [Undibacterium sp. FT147W]|uniref:Helicase n=1 Tax=Undibacterium rivi TaxID=2828729 RepID=A0ABS5H3I8_9BURK|nr:helicase [Undibacterium rivi]MBR7792902.1 helicase [Undibacterium rivi]